MEAVNEKALVNGGRIVGELKRKRAVQPAAYAGHVMVSQQDNTALSSSRCCSMVRSDDCKLRSNSSSEKHILGNYRNFMKSGLPQRVLFSQDGEWKDFPGNIASMVQGDFRMKKAISEVTHQNQQLLLDFVHMACINTESGSRKPIAWIDIHGSCFFPEFCDSHDEFDKGKYVHIPCEPNGTREINAHLDISVSAAESTSSEAPNEVVFSNIKRIKSVSSDRSSSKNIMSVFDNKNENGEFEEVAAGNERSKSLSSHRSNSKSITFLSDNKSLNVELEEAVGENEPCAVFLPKVSSLQEKVARPASGPSVLGTVQNMLLHGLGSVIDAKDIVRVSRTPLLDNIRQVRFELFRKQVEVTKNLRGNANVRYAWLASSKDAVEDIMLRGVMKINKPKQGPTYGVGVHFAPANCSNVW